MRLNELIAVMQAAERGAEIEVRDKADGTWGKKVDFSYWDLVRYDYRIKPVDDPYAALKAAAADPMKQIRCIRDSNPEWHDIAYGWNFQKDKPYWPPEDYEIRDKPKKVKYLCHELQHGQLVWYREGTEIPSEWKRVPSEDKEIEVEDGRAEAVV